MTSSTGHDKDFAVSNLAGSSFFLDDFDGIRHQLRFHNHLDFNFGHKVHLILGAPVDLLVPPLTPKPLYLADSQPFGAQFGKSVFYVVQF